jgi:hypothetical protein
MIVPLRLEHWPPRHAATTRYRSADRIALKDPRGGTWEPERPNAPGSWCPRRTQASNGREGTRLESGEGARRPAVENARLDSSPRVAVFRAGSGDQGMRQRWQKLTPVIKDDQNNAQEANRVGRPGQFRRASLGLIRRFRAPADRRSLETVTRSGP